MSRPLKSAEIVQRLLLELRLEPDVEIRCDSQNVFNCEWGIKKVTIGSITPSGNILIKLAPIRVAALVATNVGQPSLKEGNDEHDWVLVDSTFNRCWLPLAKESAILARATAEDLKFSTQQEIRIA